MKKITILSSFLFCFLSFLFADDLRILMGSASGMSQNIYVTILDAGTAEGGAAYDRATRSIINASDGTKIRVLNVDFGEGRYGSYSRLFVEYTNPHPVSDGFFDVYLENEFSLVASIPVEQTAQGEYVESSSTMIAAVSGERRIYIVWRGQAADLKTFGGYETKPFAEVKAVKSSSPLLFKFSSSQITDTEGVHKVQMVWKEQSANVFAVYFDKSGSSSVKEINRQEAFKVYTQTGILYIESKEQLKNITVYSIGGEKIYSSHARNQNISIQLNKGMYILRMTDINGNVLNHKVLME